MGEIGVAATVSDKMSRLGVAPRLLRMVSVERPGAFPQWYCGADMHRLAYLMALAATLGCESEHRIVVEVRSDLAAGYEATGVEVRLENGETLTALLNTDDSLFEPAFRFPQAGSSFVVPDGAYRIEAELRTTRGTLRRSVVVAVGGNDVGVAIALFRSCIGVACPGAGDSMEATACLGGHCVVETCLEADQAECDGAVESCQNESSCPESPTECGQAVCDPAAGCAVVGDNSRCEADEFCAATLGCQPIPMSEVVDSGPMDAGAGDGPAEDGAPEDGGSDADGAADATLDTSVDDASILPGSRGFVAVSGGSDHFCALRNGLIWCFGAGDVGQLGNGMSANAESARVANLTRATGVACGHQSCCAIQDGSVFCWGDNEFGQLGVSPTLTASSVPLRVDGMDPSHQVDVGGAHSCALRSDEVWCWGKNDFGQCGHSGGDTHVPTRVAGLNATSITVGAAHSCVLDLSGQAQCFGSNTVGQLGVPDTTRQSTTPVAVTNGSGLSRITSAHNWTLGLRVDGAVFHWGETPVGTLESAVPTGLTNATAITLGTGHGCAISGNTVECWGINEHLQLGREGPTNSDPMPVPGLPLSTMIGSGPSFSCAVTADTELWCWGDNLWGAINFESPGEDQAPTQMTVPED